jgi:hypothetical protein
MTASAGLTEKPIGGQPNDLIVTKFYYKQVLVVIVSGG